MKKRKILSLFLSLFMVLSIVSCSNNDDEEEKEKIYVYVSNIVTGETVNLKYKEIDEGTVFTEEILPDFIGNENAKFLGWFAQVDGNSNEYINIRNKSTKDIRVDYSYIRDEKVIEIYAKWEIKITVNANGGKINGNDIVKDYTFISGGSLKFTPPKIDKIGLNRSDYTFICWSNEKEGLGNCWGQEEYNYYEAPEPGEVLYAIWEKGTNIKVLDVEASDSDFENTLKKLETGDKLFVIGNAYKIEADSTFYTKGKILQQYLSNDEKRITFDLSFLKIHSGTRVTFEKCSSISSVILGRNYCNYKISTSSKYFKMLFTNCKNLKDITIRLGNEYNTYYPFTILTSFHSFFDLAYNDAYVKKIESITIGSCIDAISKDCFAFYKAYNSNGELSRYERMEYADNIIFEDTKNWYISSEETLYKAKEANDLTPIDVSNPSQNALNFTKVHRERYLLPPYADASTEEGEWYGKYLYKLQD